MSKVIWPLPLQRLNPWYPGQMGVPGTDDKTGIRLSSEGSVYYVDPNYPGASDQRDGTNPTDPLATIGAALTKCRPFRGDTIAVMANNTWDYGNPADGQIIPISEEVVITTPGIRIVGVHPSGATGVIWTPASNGGLCIDVQALDVLIEGFHFNEGAFTGVDAISALWGAPAYGDNLVVRNCVFDDTVDVAIQLEFTWYASIYQNVFWECDEYGIYVDPAGNGAAFLQIYDNIFHDCAIAMALQGVDKSHIFNNSIYNSHAQGAGAAANEGIDTTNGAENQVFDNFFSCRLPVPANGDWDDLNTAAASDAWINNHLMNGLAITNPT